MFRRIFILPIILTALLSSAFLQIPSDPATLPAYTPEAVFAALWTPEPTLAPAVPQVAERVPEAFIAQVVNGQAGQVVGVFVENKLALPVVQQPAGQGAYVSDRDGEITQFSPAEPYGSVGLLAHNFLSGQLFYSLQPGDELALVYGDGSLRFFRLSSMERFQALEPTNAYSDFIDLQDASRDLISSTEVFERIYMDDGRVVFQTCIDAEGNPSWGRLFVIGEEIF